MGRAPSVGVHHSHVGGAGELRHPGNSLGRQAQGGHRVGVQHVVAMAWNREKYILGLRMKFQWKLTSISYVRPSGKLVVSRQDVSTVEFINCPNSSDTDIGSPDPNAYEVVHEV